MLVGPVLAPASRDHRTLPPVGPITTPSAPGSLQTLGTGLLADEVLDDDS
jgi:hypothetical protein